MCITASPLWLALTPDARKRAALCSYMTFFGYIRQNCCGLFNLAGGPQGALFERYATQHQVVLSIALQEPSGRAIRQASTSESAQLLPWLRTIGRRVVQPVARRRRQHPAQRSVEVGCRHLRKQSPV